MQEKRHDEQSTAVAKFLARKFHDNPGVKITLTSHSFRTRRSSHKSGCAAISARRRPGGTTTGRRSAGEVTLFKSLGLAVEDVVAAGLAYRRAREKGFGQNFS